MFIGREAEANTVFDGIARRYAEVKAIVDTAYRRCQEVLEKNRENLEAVAEYLLEHETMSGETFAAVMGFPKAKEAGL